MPTTSRTDDNRYATITSHQAINAARSLQRNGYVQIFVRGYPHEGSSNPKKLFEQMCQARVPVEMVGRVVSNVALIPLLSNPEYMIDMHTGHAQDRLIIKVELAASDLHRVTACLNHALKTGFEAADPFSTHTLPPTEKAPLWRLSTNSIIRWLIDELSELVFASTTAAVIAESLDVLVLACYLVPSDVGHVTFSSRYRGSRGHDLLAFVADVINPFPDRGVLAVPATPFEERVALTQTLLLERARLIALMHTTKHVDMQEVLFSVVELAALCINLCLPSDFSCAAELKRHVHNWSFRQAQRSRDLFPVRSRLQRVARITSAL